MNECDIAARKERMEGRDGYIDRGAASAREGGWVFVISFELIPWEQMVNGGLPRCLEAQELQ